MAKYKIGITEAGDAGIDLSWVDKLDTVDGVILVTKSISRGFATAALANKDKLIIHATITGYGGSKLEPYVPEPKVNLSSLNKLAASGFPKSKIVIRIDPIIPTQKGIQAAKNVFMRGIDSGFSRFRVGIIDMYPHVRDRFKADGLPLPYGETGFAPGKEQVKAVDDMLLSVFAYYGGKNPMPKIECCAEPGLTNAIHCGCISHFDLRLLGLDPDEDDHVGYQRRNCMCYSGKRELLEHKAQCPHGCLYCYWRS